jgi:protein-S-isoprenylcysteine O-methyltransferase Ste14
VLIGTSYGLGFFLGFLTLNGVPPLPAFVVWGQPWGSAGITSLAWLGVAATLVAFGLRASGTAYLRRDVVFASDVQRDRLIVAGPFRFVRNPLYLGNLFLAAGVGLFAPPVGFAIIVLGNLAIVVFLAREEAGRLAAQYGTVYEAYRRLVPAFVPRLTPADVPGSSSATPSIRGALLGELGVLLMAVSLVPLAAFGQAGLPAFWILFGAAIVVSFSINRVRRRGTAR